MKNAELILEILSVCPLFQDIPNDTVYTLIQDAQCSVKTYSRHEILAHAEEPLHFLAIILSGTIDIQTTAANGDVITVFRRSKGEMFGGYTIFCQDKTFRYDVTARETCEILYITADSARSVLLKNNQVCMNLLQIFANRVYQYQNRICLYTLTSIQKKIIYSLLTDFTELECIHLPFSKTAWAEQLHVSRPSLCRELKIMSEMGLIKLNKNVISIPDRELLCSRL